MPHGQSFAKDCQHLHHFQLIVLLHHILAAIATAVSVFQSEYPCSGFNMAGELLALELTVAAKTWEINQYFFLLFW